MIPSHVIPVCTFIDTARHTSLTERAVPVCKIHKDYRKKGKNIEKKMKKMLLFAR
jgi:hypothetical protein